jgi:phytoene dehydrogenase-like protein
MGAQVRIASTPRGNLYGIEKSRKQIGPWAFPVQSEIEGLLMCGASTESHGVAGVTGSGRTAARMILRCRTSELLTQRGPELRAKIERGIKGVVRPQRLCG